MNGMVMTQNNNGDGADCQCHYKNTTAPVCLTKQQATTNLKASLDILEGMY